MAFNTKKRPQRIRRAALDDLSGRAPDSDGAGIPAAGTMDQGALEPLGRPGLHHWKQATISDPTLNERGNVFFAAIEMTRMPMILADPGQPDCPIAFANNAFLDLTGYQEGEVLGRNCRFLQGAGTDPEAVRLLREAIAECRPVALEILNYRRDATPFWNAIFMGPVFDQAGNLIYFFASQLDVTKRRESEQAMRQAQKMEAIGQLTAGLAHDFNNLLQIVNGSLDRLQSQRHDEAAGEKNIAAAMAATTRAAKLTQQLLAFARRTRLEPKNVDMSELVHSFADLLETSVGQKTELHLSLQRRLPSVRLDPNHLEMALLNIVVNARDASPKNGAVTVTTKAVHLEGNSDAPHLVPGDYVMLSVMDEGAGMPPHIQARAVEPFFTTKAPGQGTGLGLAMVHGFVQQSGGRLEIDSEPGRGTTVRMLFPKVAAEHALPSDAKVVGYQAQPVDDPTAPPMILVVDDNQEIATIARDVLLEVGYRVVVAHSGEDALEIIEKASEAGDAFSLVFSDVLMPGGINGLVLAEQLRERHPKMPIILTTGYNDEMALNGPRGNSGFEVLGKPWRPSELIDRIQAALRRGARTGPARTTSDFGHVTA